MTGFSAGELTVHDDPAQLARVTRALRATSRPVVLVPTMGALHAGHRALIRAARQVPRAAVVVSIFVNPRQFGPDEDLERYPRPLETDLDVCRAEGVELAFAPDVEAMYPPGSDTSVTPGPLGEELEGACRPGHFTGVLTVVAKLFGIVRPDRALFGEKDYQQLVLINRMAAGLYPDVTVAGMPTVREADGLAVSSRNGYLDPESRRAAVALPAALTAGAHAGRHGRDAVLPAARQVLDAEPHLAVEYLALRDRALGSAPDEGAGRLLAAATVGKTRLIDNVGVLIGNVSTMPGGG